jgi:hypothetical protein
MAERVGYSPWLFGNPFCFHLSTQHPHEYWRFLRFNAFQWLQPFLLFSTSLLHRGVT